MPQPEYFDDCEICKFMKKMEEEGKTPTLDQTQAAFQKQKEIGIGIFGTGEDLEKME